jgi:hypothetical protein
VFRNSINAKSFGALDQNGYIDITVRENLKGLLNSKEIEYPLLKPIEETNPDFEEFIPWNLTDLTF